MVAGLVAAEANNDQCIVGIAHNCTILGRQVKDIPEKQQQQTPILLIFLM